MFKTIYVHEHESNLNRVDPFQRKSKSNKLYFDDEFAENCRAIFILTNDTLSNETLSNKNPDKICGGAFLLQSKASRLPPQFRKHLNPFFPSDQKVWIGSIKLELRYGISRQDFERLSSLFYRKLYKALIAFGRQTKTEFLYLSLGAYEHLATEILENWPYIQVIRPKPSEKRFFYSILDLTGHEVMRETTFQQKGWNSLRHITKAKEVL